MDKSIHHKETAYGFEFGQASVERCWSHKGAVCIRVKSLHDGRFVDIQLSPGGRKIFTTQGQMTSQGKGDSDGG